METYIQIANLNDFIFCPRSIYFHGIYSGAEKGTYDSHYQVAGTQAHKSIDNGTYSTRAEILQGIEVFCAKYNLCGKIDTFNIKTKTLTERKRAIQKIYDGYIFQVYAQYFALIEMGYTVEKINIYDISHNKTYDVLLPEQDQEMVTKFEEVVYGMQHFDLNVLFVPNPAKCQHCIYANLCDKAIC
ncbi:CRISPR-associated protein Cas4 [Candidatus Termititenax dinenymphae]|uniref:CRISPR-associated protein Cas4 n=1 Tax=Candidatus Termititenax dinenymphae TaxID=2218523 RepID=A0A388TJZ8_9BACT|nr:CRISPR-associated protein Cas4 [Candidatus Termititenax dinenymphae]